MQVYSLKNVDEAYSLPKHLDCLLLACGADNRAYEILRKFQAHGISVDRVILFDFIERNEGLDNDKQTKEAYCNYQKYNYNYLILKVSLMEPSAAIKTLKEQGIDFASLINIGLDISCFTKPFFFLLMKVLKSEYSISIMAVFYTEPKSYFFAKGLYDSYRSSSGPLRVIEVPGFTGVTTRRSKRLLVIQLGFDGDLSREINEDVAPAETIIINGFPSYEPKLKDISLICNEKLVGNPRNVLKYSRANNPFEVYNLLDSLKKGNSPDVFMNIAPLGTKPMALGACLFALHNPDVRIVYPMPQKYEKVTTDNCWTSWFYKMPLTA